MTHTRVDPEIQLRLRRFWGVTFFSLGILWGFSSLVYVPVAVLTTVRGSSYPEVFIIVGGGLLVFFASIWAFYRKRAAAILLLVGGIFLLAAAAVSITVPRAQSSNAINLLLTSSSGVVACLLGLFGWITDVRGWPKLRG
ncbi:MAG TPA: hypothetical protein VHX63_12140 [Acidobacteriaceae bacterium]|jgi:hypothetical protein|nr:hypothetical protein [Acidobacteriaceae bacterium]